MAEGPFTPVDAAPILAPRLGLLASAIMPDTPAEDVLVSAPLADGGDVAALMQARNAERWIEGLTWVPEPWADANASIYDPQCGGVDPGFTGDTIGSAPTYSPPAIWAGFACATPGRGVDLEGRAKRALAAHASRQVERELWSGAQAIASGWANRYFTKAGLASVITTVRSPIRALAELEDWAGDQAAGLAYIHAPRRLVTYWVTAQLLRREGNRLLTAYDNIVVPGEGYTGAAPSGEAAGTDDVPWAFVSRPVTVRLGPIDVYGPGSDRRSTNLDTYVATQPFAATFDPSPLGALRVTLCNTTDC